jgi:ferredoxin-NADP reductase
MGILSATSAVSRWRGYWQQLMRIALVQPSMRSYVEPLVRLWRPKYRAGLCNVTLIHVERQGRYLHLWFTPSSSLPPLTPGAHLDLLLDNNGRLQGRTFSVCSSLDELDGTHVLHLPDAVQQALGAKRSSGKGVVQLCVEILEHGQFTPLLWQQIQQGQRHFYLASPQRGLMVDYAKPMLLMAAGSGITPMRSILLSMRRQWQSVTLVYSYRGANNALFLREWAQLQLQFPGFQLLLVDTSYRDRFHVSELMPLMPDLSAHQIIMTGAYAALHDWQQQLLQLGVAGRQIQQEFFQLPSAVAGHEQAPAVALVVEQAGQRHHLTGQGLLLPLLEAHQLQPRFGCRRGICQQCLCQKRSGQVRNVLTGDVSGAESGFIQLCISEALTDVVLELTSGDQM